MESGADALAMLTALAGLLAGDHRVQIEVAGGWVADVLVFVSEGLPEAIG